MFQSLLIIILLLHVAVTALDANPGHQCVVPKYFAVDIDHTFFTIEEDVLNKNIDAFHEAIAAGNVLFFCTGRAYAPNATYITPFFALKTGYNGCPGVYCNGAVVLDQRCNVLYKAAFSKEVVATILDFVEENQYQSYNMFSDGQGYYTLADSLSFYNTAQRTGRVYNAEQKTRTEILAMDILKAHFAIWIDVTSIKSLTEGTDYIAKPSAASTVISPPQVTKARGVVALSTHLNIDPHCVGFIGDGYNDIELMDISKYSYAVGNAPPEVKKHAKFVLETPYDQGAFAEAMSLVYNLSPVS